VLKGTLAFVLLLILALAGADLKRRWSRGRRRLPGFEGFVTVLVGALLGNAGLGLFPADLTAALRPVVLLGLAWIGLLVGLQFDVRLLRWIQPWQRWMGFLVPFGAGSIAGGAALAVGCGLHGSILLAAVAMISSPRLIGVFLRSGPPADRSAMRLIRLVTALASTPALIVYGVGMTLMVPAGGPLGRAAESVVGAGLAVVLGYATIILLRREHEEIHVLALLLGIVALLAGAATMIRTEPMLTAAIAGAIISNRGHLAHRALRAAHAIETPMLTAILVLLGAWWLPRVPSLAVCAVLVGIRGAAMVAGGGAMAAVARGHGVRLRTRLLGMGLLPQGPLALALLVGGAVAGGVDAAFAGGIFTALVINHAIGGAWMHGVLFRRATRSGGRHA